MENHASTAAIDRGSSPDVGRWESLENERRRAFVLAGALVLASLVTPVGLSAVTDLAWLAGLGLVGLGVASVAVGLLGLYPAVDDRSPRLAVAGAVCAGVAGAAATALVGLTVAALASVVAFGVEPAVPMALFVAVALLMAVGYALGFLLFGMAGRSAAALPGTSVRLLLVGGGALLVPAVGELARVGFGVGPPPWTVFPVLAVAGLATLGVGVTLRPAAG